MNYSSAIGSEQSADRSADRSERCDDVNHFLLIDSVLSAMTLSMFTLATLALFTNLLLVACVTIGVRKGSLPLKRLVLVANRSLADAVTAAVCLIYLLIESLRECDPVLGCDGEHPYVTPRPLQIAITLDYWAVASTYSGIALLTWYAVKSPFLYKVRLTVRFVLKGIALGWACMVAVMAAVFLFTRSSSNFDSNGMIYVILHKYSPGDLDFWAVDLCSQIEGEEGAHALAALLLPVTTFLGALVSYILVSFYLYRRRGETGVNHRHLACILRLGLHIGLFAVTCGLMALAYNTNQPMFAWCSAHLSPVAADPCSESAGYNPLIRHALMTALASTGWFIRMIADPIIDIMVDASLRRVISHRPRHRLSNYTLTVDMHKMSSVSRHHSNAAEPLTGNSSLTTRL